MSLNLGGGRKKGLSSSFVGAGEKKKGGLLDDVDEEDSEDDAALDFKPKGGMGGSVLVSASMIQRYEKALGIKPDKVVIQQPKVVDDEVNSDVGSFSSDDDE